MEKPGLTRLCQSTEYVQVDLPGGEQDTGKCSSATCKHWADPPAKEKACRWEAVWSLGHDKGDRAMPGKGVSHCIST